MTEDKPVKSGKPNKRAARSAARMAAVQALYQMEIAGTDVVKVIAEFSTVRAEAGVEGAPEGVAIARADRTFFAELVRGVVRRQRDIDPEIDQQLAQGWRLARVDSILRQTLRTGLFELIERTETPPRVVITEYIEIAKDFFDGEEPRVVNGVLDRLARKFRADDGSLRPDVALAARKDTHVPAPGRVADKSEDGAPAVLAMPEAVDGTDEPKRKTLRLPQPTPAQTPAPAINPTRDADPDIEPTGLPATSDDDNAR